MFVHDDRLVLSATDLVRHVGCAHATVLEREVALGRLDPPAGEDVGLQMVAAHGDAHEAAYLEQLRAEGRQVVEISDGGPPAEREARTLEAMRAGAEVVYQATLFDGTWLGHADFLVRDERPSGLGPWSYDVVDTKLSRHLSVAALLQMSGYADRLARLQGAPVERLTVVAGDGAEHVWRPADVADYAARLRRGVTEFVAVDRSTEAVPGPGCSRCRWHERCTAEWVERDDLSRVAGMRSSHRQALLDAGISTVEQLADAHPDRLRGVLSERVRGRLHAQARIQVTERRTGATAYVLLPPAEGQGLQLLPEPDPGDVYLDFEGDPFADGGAGREYLAGVWTRDGEFLDWWAHDTREEARLTRDLLTWLLERWEQHPGMHVYHYAAYEVTALKRMTTTHAVAESELDRLLRGSRFVDLYQVVRQGLLLSKESYSIKKVEDFYWDRTRTAGEGEVADGLSSVVEYERWLAQGRTDQAILDAIRSYNRDDVRSTHDLHAWLEERREELAALHAGTALRRFGGRPVEETADGQDAVAEAELAGRLVDAGHELLAGLVGWHRREDRQAYWDFFRTEKMSTDELVEDQGTIGGVEGPPRAVGSLGRSTVWEYRFPPQAAVMSTGGPVSDARTHDSVGTVVDVDGEAGWVRVKRGNASAPLVPEGMAQKQVIGARVLQRSLARLGESALRGEDSLGLRLLRRRTPLVPPREAGESAGDLMHRVGMALHGEVLAVQGPPGSGKSYTGARLVRSLLDAGLRVGVTAQAHRVVADLMASVERPGVRKDGRKATEGLVRVVSTNGDVDRALAEGQRFVGGTAWLWSREEMRGSVDVLVVDEAGQFSLANAAAVAQAARSMVLLGDPQQLRSPTNGTHPHGAGVSALEHLVGDHDTIDPTRGIFLDRTWRMHPEITRFVSGLAYEDRLESQPGTERQRVEAPGALSGSGLRWLAVPHAGNATCSEEEVEVVARLVGDLLRGRWTDMDGAGLSLRPSDVLVVAPYNAHVDLLRRTLPDEVPVGTVDKFQGHEGAVVIYAMASSSAQEAPRGVSFLYDVHRLNVAVSRARALAAVVGSPALLEAPVSTPEQLRSVNALCRFAAMAEKVA